MRKRTQQGEKGTPDQDADGIRDADIEHSYAKLPRPHMGRPVVAEVLASLCKQHSTEASIGVIAAGKSFSSLESLCERVARRHADIGSMQKLDEDLLSDVSSILDS